MRKNIWIHENDILELWNNNYGLSEICMMITSINRNSITKILRSNGIDTKSRSYKWIPIETQQNIINEYTNGSSITSIFGKYHVTPNIIERILKRNKLEIRDDKKSYSEYFIILDDPDVINDLISSGSVNQISERFSIPHWAITKFIKDNNIPFIRKYPKSKEVDIPTKEMIIYLRLEECLNPVEISKITGISRNLISTILRDNPNHNQHSPIPENKRQGFQEYSKKCRRLTKIILNQNNMGNKIGFHWNHKFSIVDGFRNNIPYELICARFNLEQITCSENISLGWKSKITKEEFINEVLSSLQ